MDGSEFIAESIAALEESVRYFSPKNKASREWWVVETLLVNMNISHKSDDIINSEQDPPDVLAFGGRFEIKEILDPHRRRHEEYKEALRRAKVAATSRELLTEFPPVDCSLQDIIRLCAEKVESLKTKYSSKVMQDMDLLFYVNLHHVFEVNETANPDLSAFASCGWRSITFIKGQIACCLFATENSPGWLQGRVGHVYHKVWKD